MLRAIIVFALFASICAHAPRASRSRNKTNGTTTTEDTNAADPVRDTPAGRVLGSWMQTRAGRSFESYRGIRYAEPPTGELRFKPPVDITSYQDDADGRNEGPACVQPSVTPGFLVDEDCLRLNVYTPGYRSPGLPVIVYMHPGGFYSGTGRSDVSGPLYLLEKNLVLVTINYRLGSLGYLSTGDKWAPGNYGFKDQVSAFRWVQRNIRAFGGDPTRVTLAGYSAGSLSIGLHMVSPMSKGLFHGAIMSSASPISQVVIGPHQRHLAVRQGQLLGCNETRSKELVDCLKTKPWRAFADTLDEMFEFGFDPVLLWNAVLEPACCGPRFLEEQPLAVIESGRMYAVPTLIGQTRDEFFWKAFNILNNATLFTAMKRHWSSVAPIAFMLPAGGSGQEPTDNQTQGTGGIVPAVSAARTLRHAYIGSGKLRNNSRTADALGKLYSDAIIGFAVHRMTRLLARYSPRPVHAYEFAYIGERSYYEDPNTMRPVGVAHHDDLLYLFSIRAGFPDVVPGTRDDRIVETYISIWYQMASTGDPTPPNVYWPVFTPSKRQYLRISDNLTVHQNLFEDRYNVWDELYPVQY